MNQILKYAGLFAILPLFVVALSPDYVGGVQAEEETSMEIFAISEIGENMYKVVFTVPNNSDIANISIDVSSSA